ncbi:MAG: hypothetical protein JSV80_14865, partial [Acidobacteriota bacterium]
MIRQRATLARWAISAVALVASVVGAPASSDDSSSDHLRVVARIVDGSLSLVRLETAPRATRRVSRHPHGWWAETRAADGSLLDARFVRDPRLLHVEWYDASRDELTGGEILLERVTFARVL